MLHARDHFLSVTTQPAATSLAWVARRKKLPLLGVDDMEGP